MWNEKCGIKNEGTTRNQEPDNHEKQLARAKNIAYRFLAIRPRSHAEVEAKLLEKKFPDAVVRDVLASLEQLGYVEDCTFARQWAAARIRLQGFGKRRIELELRAKGIGREIIAETLADLVHDEAELKTARETAHKKLKTLQSADLETRRRRLAGFLERKGFSYDVIRVVLAEINKMHAASWEAR